MGLTSHIVRACRELTTKIIVVSKVTSRLVEFDSTHSKNKSTWIYFPIIFAATIFLFYPSLTYYFFQDDWFVLNWVREGNLASFFSFRTDIIYWRPLSMPILFALVQSIFGTNPTAFHLIALLFHLVNIVLVYFLFTTLKISKTVSAVIAFIYATASFHFIPISWLSTTSYILGPTFIFATLIFFIRGKLVFSITTFLLALTSSELALITIPILLILASNLRSTLKKLLHFILISAIYLALRFAIFPVPRTGEYEIIFDEKVFVNLFWYLVWTFNIPEKMSTIFFFANIKSSILASLQFYNYLILPLISIVFTVIVIAVSKLKFRELIKGAAWFIIGILPVLFLPKHIYPMYLVVGVLGIFYLLGLSFDRINKRYLIITFSAIWFISAMLTLSFTRKTHWIPNEQAISRAYINYTKKQIPDPLPNSTFLFKPADHSFSKEHNFILVETEDNVRQSLNDQDAIKVIYNDSTLRSIYLTHQEPSLITEHANVFEISPRER